jgi:predicted transcriptional regulator
MKSIELQEDQALVMQVVNEAGEEVFENLMETLKFDRSTLLHLLQNLHHKHLVVLENNRYGTYVHLSSKGKKTIGLIWPELPYIRYS